MSFNWSTCYPAESACPPYCTLFSCDEIYGVIGPFDGNAFMYNTIRTIDACSACNSRALCSGWNNTTRSETAGAASSLRYSVAHCDMTNCSTVYVDACGGYVHSVVLVSIIAFLSTSILGFFFIQIYTIFTRRRPSAAIVYRNGTGFDTDTYDDDTVDKACQDNGLVLPVAPVQQSDANPAPDPKPEVNAQKLPSVQENAVV